MQQFFSSVTLYTVSGLVAGAIYALFALGYTLVYGVLRLINFAHSEVFMLGTFATVGVWGVMGYTENTPPPGLGMFVVLMVVALIASAATSGATAVVAAAAMSATTIS